MRKALIALFTLIPAAASAANYATGDCTGQNGAKYRYAIHQGQGVISYNGGKIYNMFTKRDGEHGIITHVGDIGTMILAVNFRTGRGYIITKFDDGRTFEQNVICKLGLVER